MVESGVSRSQDCGVRFDWSGGTGCHQSPGVLDAKHGISACFSCHGPRYYCRMHEATSCISHRAGSHARDKAGRKTDQGSGHTRNPPASLSLQFKAKLSSYLHLSITFLISSRTSELNRRCFPFQRPSTTAVSAGRMPACKALAFSHCCFWNFYRRLGQLPRGRNEGVDGCEWLDEPGLKPPEYRGSLDQWTARQFQHPGRWLFELRRPRNHDKRSLSPLILLAMNIYASWLVIELKSG
jgi:hypothetical protein